MEYINSYTLFTESHDEISTDKKVGKYELVEFSENYIIRGIFSGGKENLDITVNKGERLKLYFDVSKTSSSEYNITAFRPISAKENESSDIGNLSLSSLWEADFILIEPIIINRDNSPFKIEKYLS